MRQSISLRNSERKAKIDSISLRAPNIALTSSTTFHRRRMLNARLVPIIFHTKLLVARNPLILAAWRLCCNEIGRMQEAADTFDRGLFLTTRQDGVA
jgi:hypothetical protein